MDALSTEYGIDKETVLKIADAKDIFEVNLALDGLPEPAQDCLLTMLLIRCTVYSPVKQENENG
jgi:hypothetical protein